MAKSDNPTPNQYPMDKDQKALIAALTEAILGSRHDRPAADQKATDAGIQYRAIRASLETAIEAQTRLEEQQRRSDKSKD